MIDKPDGTRGFDQGESAAIVSGAKKALGISFALTAVPTAVDPAVWNQLAGEALLTALAMFCIVNGSDVDGLALALKERIAKFDHEAMTKLASESISQALDATKTATAIRNAIERLTTPTPKAQA